MVRRSVNRLIGAMTAAVLITGWGLGPQVPAQAADPDPGVSDVVAFLGGGSATENLATWTEGLAAIGAFGQPIPFVSASPGGLAGLDDLVQKGVADRLTGMTTWAALDGADATFALSAGRNATLDVAVEDLADGKRVNVGLTITRTVSNQALTISSAEPKVELSAPTGVTVAVEASMTFSAVWTGPATDRVHLASDALHAPRVDVDASATLSAAAKAALGILDVSLTSTDFVVKAHAFAQVSDPNNDGRLAFDESGTGDGELAAEGSLQGLVTAGLDPTGSPSDPGTPGSVSGTLTVNADASGLGSSFPTFSATVGVAWPNISTGTPVISAPNLESVVGKFQNMSLRDLADGLAQVATALTGIQKAKFDADGSGPGTAIVGDLDLPFLRGTVSDAVKANEVLLAFLKANVVQAPDPSQPAPPGFDASTVGNPKFTSLQDLITKLKAAGIPVDGLDWNPTTSKLSFHLTMTKAAPSSPVPMDAGAAKVSKPGASYTADGLSISDGTAWEPGQWIGMRVVAGTSAGEVAANTATSLTLATDWIGGQPADTTPFVILGPEAQLGAVTFGDGLSKLPAGSPADGPRQGILKANAAQTFAKVTPSFTADLTLVLDLQKPRTGAECVGFEGNTKACPFTLESGTFKTEVTSLPLGADRVMIRTGVPLLKADFPIETKVDLTANAGFFQVRLEGDLLVCNRTAAPDCSGSTTGNMVTIGLKQAGDAQHDLRLRDLFKGLVTATPTGPSQAGDLLDVAVNVRAFGDLKVSVPEAGAFFPGGAKLTAKATWADLTKSSGSDGPQFDLSDLDKILALDFKPGSQAELFAIVLKTLQTLAAQLAEAQPGGPTGIFSTEIPGAGTSLRDLLRRDLSGEGPGVSYGADTLTDTNRTFPTTLAGRSVVVGTQVAVVTSTNGGSTLTVSKPWANKPATGAAYTFRSPLDDAIDAMSAHPPQNMQDLVSFLNKRLGTNSLKFAYLDGATPSVVLDFDWQRTYTASSPVRLDLGDDTLVTASASGTGKVAVEGTIDVGVVVPLAAGPGATDASSLKILDNSKISVLADARFDGTASGTLGPLTISAGTGPDPATVRANVSLDLAKNSAPTNTPVSFSTFLGDLGATLNASNDPTQVTCGETLNTPLAVCARIPLTATIAGVTTSLGSPARLRLPDSGNVADLTTFTGVLPSDPAVPRFQAPDGLAAALASAVADFTQIKPGLDGYLEKLEQAMRLATFEGKLLFVGKDLQQGADKIAALRAELKAELGSIPATAAEARDYLNTQIAKAIADAGLDNTNVEVGFECSAKLEPAAAPSVTPTPDDGGSNATWTYRIVASQGDGTGNTGDTVRSAEGSASTSWTALDNDHFNTLTWPSVTGATKYKILRQNGTDFGLVKVVNAADGATQTYVDKDPTAPAAYDHVTTKPDLEACVATDIEGVNITIDLNIGEVDTTLGCKAGTGCLGDGDTLPLDIGIPGLALRAGDADAITYGLGLQLHLKAAIDKDQGFYVYTHDAAAPEFQVGARFDMPPTMQAELAFLDIEVKKNNGSVPLFAGAFMIDVQSGDASETATSKLTIADFGSVDPAKLFDIKLTAAIKADWIVKASASSVLPGVQANFFLEWGFTNKDLASLGAPKIDFKDVKLDAGGFFSQLLRPVLNKIKSVTGPIQPVIDTLYAPIPVLSDLSKLAGGGDVSLITLAKAFNTLAGGPDLEFVERITALVTLVNNMPKCEGASCLIDVGAFSVPGDKALTTSVSPTSADSLVVKDPTTKTGDALKGELNTKGGQGTVFGTGGGEGSANKSGFTFPILDSPASIFGVLMGSDVALVEFDSGPLTLGFTWRQSFGPVYAPPPVMVTLSGSASVSLRFMAGLDTAGIRYAVEAAQSKDQVDALKILDGLYFKTTDSSGKPVPVVRLDGEIAAGASVTALIIEVGIEGGLHLTIGFHWNDPNNDGKFRVSEFLKAAINNPICLFTTTGRLSLFLRVYITIGFSPFSTSFSFTLADITLLDFTVQPDCDPPPPRLGGTVGTTLVVFAGKFGTDGVRGAPWGNTADTEADTVKVTQLHFAQKTGDDAGTNPDFDGFSVQMLGERRDYLDPNLQRVVVDGRGSPAPLIVSFVGDGKKDSKPNNPTTAADLTVFSRDAIVIGSDHADQIQTGTGSSWVDSGKGDDRVVTADVVGKVARVAGGDGADAISTGEGDDFVSGDGTLGTPELSQTVTVNAVDKENHGDETVGLDKLIDWTKLATDPTTGAQTGTGIDIISVGLGTNRANGGPGDDKIGVASDRSDGKGGTITSKGNTLIGDLGSDSIAGGSAKDVIFASTETTFGVDDPGPADTLTVKDGKAVPNIIETGTGNDEVYGSNAEDIVTSHSKKNEKARLRGGSGPDALVGGYGSDEVFGGPGNDYVIAEPSEVGARGLDEKGNPRGPDVIEGVSFGDFRAVRHLPLPPNTAPSDKTLVGGKGNDHILGGDGPAKVFGDTLRDVSVAPAPDETCRDGSPVASDPVAEGTSAGTGDGNDLILGGAGVDTISAGGARDRVLAAGSADFVCGQEGHDVLFGGDGDDGVWGGSDNDRAYGEAGHDRVFGNDDEDELYGQVGTDIIEGNDGADRASGGDGDDLVYGGTRHAGRSDTGPAADPDAGDILSGDTGADRLIGDNGTVDDPLNPGDAKAIPFDLVGTPATAGRGDVIHGGDGTDTAYGGLGDDQVNGGNDDDHLEGNNDSDTIHGDAGEDQVVGGSFQVASSGIGRPDAGDVLFGDAGPDLITGDNAILVTGVIDAETTPVTRMRGFAANHAVQLLDLDPTNTAGNWGADEIYGGGDEDVILGQRGDDRIMGNAADDYAEGGPGTDWVEGNAGDDDLVGGSSDPSGGTAETTETTETTAGQGDAADALFGGPGDDVSLGDNGRILRPADAEAPSSVTVRLGSAGGTAMAPRRIEAWDRSVGSGYLTAPPATRFGGDRLSGGDGVDVLLGQDGDDVITGDAHADYVEGNGGADSLFGDLPFGAASEHGTPATALVASWPGTPSSGAVLVGTSTTHGQDDIVGGTPTPDYRDGGDIIEGNGADDVAHGDNGSLLRTLQGSPGALTERVYTDRYPDGAVPADATRSRTHDPALPGPSTRFCLSAATATTCETTGAFGNDRIWGDGGNDGIWGQDGNDVISGGDGDDDLYGELGDDRIRGDAGRDAILGDRGGIVNQHLSEGDQPQQFTHTLKNPPMETFAGFRRGDYDRRVDLLHDVDGDQWLGASTGEAMSHPGLTEGGRDLIRGGPDADRIHAGFGDDVANGDSGGDNVFGGDGEDVLWGGRGCDPTLDAAASDCRTDGSFDPASRGDNDRFVDHVFGGRGESDPAKQDILGSDVIDLRPRGGSSSCTSQDWPTTTGTKKNNPVTNDPCLWFEMTDTHDGDVADNNHHQGTDWLYGGWDRDVMQGDVAANGPNPGDRLIDWSGVYNLYTHCNAAYGGFNDIRQMSPDLLAFLQQLAWASGAGRDVTDVTTAGTSAFVELALVYTADINGHGSGPAYPSTPGHFQEVACQP
ncbi:calcium-binding protein [Intrasporangium calvum]|uniref:Calcium-binding protein n=1 Tax=Intrasporangium calvum TaxID=53358 RepID=A0ABT5GFM8_9MICO|nr:calcium-binding protein [Intrasporangium calvum]MDC5696918.1 calcium-binding protein [Intrasporangium calvum]